MFSFPLESLINWVLQEGAAFPGSSIAPSQIPCPVGSGYTRPYLMHILELEIPFFSGWWPQSCSRLPVTFQPQDKLRTSGGTAASCWLGKMGAWCPLLTGESLMNTKCTSGVKWSVMISLLWWVSAVSSHLGAGLVAICCLCCEVPYALS